MTDAATSASAGAGTQATPLPRDQFPVADQVVYLNHAGIAPIPRVAADAISTAADEFCHIGGPAFDHYDDLAEEVRASAARLMGAPVSDVAFVKNTSEGLGFVANGLSWQPGDRVIVPDLEFPSTVYPWLALRDRGVQVDLLTPAGEGRTLPIELFEEALAAAPTKLVCLSWVQFGRGWRTDLGALAEVCHRHDALLCVDVIQGLGVLPCALEAWGVDFAMADAHKWMLGPLGTGVFYVAERCRDLLTPLEPGWASVAHREEWDNLELVYDHTARRFEGGSANVMGIAGMGASIDLLLDSDVARIWNHVDALCERLCDGVADIGAAVLSDRSAEGRSANVTVAVDGVSPDTLWEHLDLAGIVCAARGGGIRLAPHGYNTADDIDRAVEIIATHRTG